MQSACDCEKQGLDHYILVCTFLEINLIWLLNMLFFKLFFTVTVQGYADSTSVLNTENKKEEKAFPV